MTKECMKGDGVAFAVIASRARGEAISERPVSVRHAYRGNSFPLFVPAKWLPYGSHVALAGSSR